MSVVCVVTACGNTGSTFFINEQELEKDELFFYISCEEEYKYYDIYYDDMSICIENLE